MTKKQKQKQKNTELRWQLKCACVHVCVCVCESSGPCPAMADESELGDGEWEESREPPWYIMKQSNPFRRGWDLTQSVILIYVAYVVPFRVGMQEPAVYLWFALDLVIDAYFWVDIVANFFTSYMNDETGAEEYQMDKIRAKYLQGWFWIDIIASIPLDSIERINDGSFVCSFEREGCEAGKPRPFTPHVTALKLSVCVSKAPLTANY